MDFNNLQIDVISLVLDSSRVNKLILLALTSQNGNPPPSSTGQPSSATKKIPTAPLKLPEINDDTSESSPPNERRRVVIFITIITTTTHLVMANHDAPTTAADASEKREFQHPSASHAKKK